MTDRVCWGVFRERTHSPGRESDDAEILRLTAKQLEARGFHVSLRSPDDLDGPGDRPPSGIFLMCERAEPLRQVGEWERRGVRVVNTALAVLNTYRERMLACWESAPLPFPRSVVVPTLSRAGHFTEPAWVKRADVHNTQDGDVVFASTAGGVQAALQGLARRGIPRAVIQEHVEGDLIKFYGVGTARRVDGQVPWFRWFYHRDQQLAGHPLDPGRLTDLARRAAEAVGLEVFGGDAIVTRDGTLSLIDLNAWPSFALYRDEAAAEIAAYLEARFAGPGA